MNERIPLPKHRRPTTPGEIIREEFMIPLNLTQQALATALHMDRPGLNTIVNGNRSITPIMALKLEKVLGPSAQFWLNIQQSVELWDALHDDTITDEIEALEPLVATG
jgi:antitoxin HigA-1